MLDSREFSRIEKDLEAFENDRESQITTARTVIKLSKLVIYSLHRDDLPAAKKHVSEMEKSVKLLSRKYLDEGLTNVAYQEYAEAMTYFSFINSNKLVSQKDLKVTTEEYLCGLADLTGELVRRAVNDVIKGNTKDALRVRDLVDELYGAFLRFNLRNGELRKKTDSIKWNLKKLDEIALELKLRK